LDVLFNIMSFMFGLVHAAHAAGHSASHRSGWCLLLDVAKDTFCCEEHTGDGCCVFEGHTGNLGGVDNAALEQDTPNH